MSGRVEAIDLLRGIAVALVLLRHAFPGLFPGAGVVGVVMFFTLSGYLITGVLLGELERTGRVDLGRFYRRRARRLVPALVVLVVAVVLVTLLLDPLDDRDRLLRTVAVALTWTGNLPVGETSDATFHLWTLATEEQFYLFWPVVLALGFARRKVGVTLLAVGGVCVLACVATVVWLAEEPDLAYTLPTSWAVCFVVGAAARWSQERVTVPARAVPVALVALAVLSVVPLRGHVLTYLAGGPAIAALTAVLLLAWRTWDRVATPVLRPLVALGTVSYGAYLWNYPLTVWLRPHVEHAGAPALALTAVFAALSWHLVERPLQSPARVEVAA
ncbi:acyltransferase family protein [Cellulomonas oligotrophica]|uniref:Peptidoglycan/LPS O-acetylase OafA/YrhL n=1 Tax=Cellulomonas oligotrophica TaxID=931536 RepID=A0A7Y9FF85_9CELL|nr:acyltransferase [Cellulomonas oligotrophica]NYD86244.1 peptidoglycan/LPS O-acetylase OafA/YrhL [Cellulomonas oligotrophica]GIG34429.1 hypothetical protein Col01nite_35880 [Cellulomonas oligotrophica]